MDNNLPYYNNKKLDIETNKHINAEIMKYAGMYILKKMDIAEQKKENNNENESKEQNIIIFELPLNEIDTYIEPVLDDLLFNNLITINVKEAIYQITEEGHLYIDRLIEEIENYIDKYADFEPATRVSILKRDRVNPLRVRFLWGLYDGEFDDFDLWQDNFNIDPKDRIKEWQFIITKKDFYDILFEEINNMEQCDDEEIDKLLLEARIKREEDIRKEKEEQKQQEEKKLHDQQHSGNGHEEESNVYYYNNPHYFNPMYDPLFWFLVF